MQRAPDGLFVLASLTTVPSRSSSLHMIVKALEKQTRTPDVLTIIAPEIYHTWKEEHGHGPSVVAEWMTAQAYSFSELVKRAVIPLEIFRPTHDYGPAMKVIGALQYLQSLPAARRPLANHTLIVTVEDDMLMPPWLVANFVRWSLRYPEAALTLVGCHAEYSNSMHSCVSHGCGCTNFTGLVPSSRRDSRSVPPCSARKVNRWFSWAGTALRPEFFDDWYWNVAIGFLGGNATVNDDTFHSAYLSRQRVPILVLPVPYSGPGSGVNHQLLHRSKTSAWLNHSKHDDSEVKAREIRLLHRFVGTGLAERAPPTETVCAGKWEMADDAKECESKAVPKECRG